jgi:hypothetical protein
MKISKKEIKGLLIFESTNFHDKSSHLKKLTYQKYNF